MGTFTLESIKVNNKVKGWYIEDNPYGIKKKVLDGTETVKVEIDFLSYGDTSDFTEEDILNILSKLIKELKKE